MKTKLLLVLVILASFIACEKKNEGPIYAGTWEKVVENDTVATDPFTIVLNQKMVITLTKDTWKMVSQIKIPPVINDYTEYVGFKGTMTVDGEDAEIVFTDAGIRQFDTQNLTFIDAQIIWYNATDDPTMFSSVMNEYGPDYTTVQAKMTVSGNTLTMKTDDNMNGQFEEDEIQVFTKVN